MEVKIDLDKLSSATLYHMAKDFGCEIEFPINKIHSVKPVDGKLVLEEELDKENQKIFRDYYKILKQWLWKECKVL